MDATITAPEAKDGHEFWVNETKLWSPETVTTVGALTLIAVKEKVLAPGEGEYRFDDETTPANEDYGPATPLDLSKTNRFIAEQKPSGEKFWVDDQELCSPKTVTTVGALTEIAIEHKVLLPTGGEYRFDDESTPSTESYGPKSEIDLSKTNRFLAIPSGGTHVT